MSFNIIMNVNGGKHKLLTEPIKLGTSPPSLICIERAREALKIGVVSYFTLARTTKDFVLHLADKKIVYNSRLCLTKQKSLRYT